MIFEERIREKSARYLHVFEALLFIVVVLPSAAAAGKRFRQAHCRGVVAVDKAAAGYALVVLDQLLLVLMLVDLLHQAA